MGCLTGSQVVDMLSGLASAELASHIDVHVDTCSGCRNLVANLSHSMPSSSGLPSPTEPGSRTPIHAEAGSVSHRYRTLGVLGEGGMGRVYRALDRLTGIQVALKQVLVAPGFGWQGDVASGPPWGAVQEELSPGGHTTPPAFSRTQDNHGPVRHANLGVLAEEFRTLAAVRHPHVISVLDYGFDADRQPFYTMELLQNAQSLLRFSQDRPAAEQIELLIQLLYALAYLHRRGIVHRDLSPSNVLVVPGPEGPLVKVVDFGLAVDADRAGRVAAVGTPLYMAPELYRGEPASASSDLYAVGAMAYRMLTGRSVFETLHGTTPLIQQVLRERPDLSPLEPALRPVIGRALSKAPESRQADAATLLRELATAVGITLKSEPVAARDSYLVAARFVGRRGELEQLRMALAETQRGRGSGWLISGESGVGKSRLLEELRSSALIAGVLTARGQAMPGGAAYHLWQDVLKIVALQVPLSELEASVLGTILPDLSMLLERPVAAPQELDAPSARLRLLHVVGEALERLGQTALLLLDDLQWADTESLNLLSHITRSPAARRLLIIATYREEEAPRLAQTLSQLQKLQLHRLTTKDMEVLCESMLGSAGEDKALVDWIARETEGNTYFIVEVMRALAAESGSLANIGRSGLPQRVFAGGVEQVLERRLARVPEVARPLLHLAAVAGRQLDVPLMTCLLPDAETQIRELADVGVLELHMQSWRFSHDKLRDRVGVTLDQATSQALHGRLAQGLEQVYPGEPSHAQQLARHYREALQLAAAARCYRLAGDEALRRGAPGESAAMFDQARLLHLRVAVPRLEQIPVWRGLTETQFALGRDQEAEAALRRLCMLAGKPLPTSALGLWSAVGQLVAALVASSLGRIPKAPPAGSEERTILNELYLAMVVSELFVWTDQAGLGLLCALWGIQLQQMLAASARGNYSGSSLFFILSHTPLRGLCRLYLDREQRVTASLREEIGYLRTRALIEISDGRFAAATEHASQAVALARESKDDLSLLYSLLELQLAVGGLDDFPRMLMATREMEPLAARAENPRYLMLAYVGQGAARLALGEFSEAAALMDKALAFLPQSLGPVPDAAALGLAAACAHHLRQSARAEELAEQALSAVQRARWPLVQLRHPLVFILEIYLCRPLSAHRTAQIEAARTRLHQIASQFPQAVPGDQLFQGIYYWQYGPPRRALRCFRKSIQVAAKLGMRHDQALAQYWLGCFAQSPAGRRLVDEGAEPHLDAALATFQLLGTSGDAARTRVARAAAEHPATSPEFVHLRPCPGSGRPVSS